MQEAKKKKLSQLIKNIFAKSKRKKTVIILIVVLILASFAMVITPIIVKTIRIKQIEGKPLLSYEVVRRTSSRTCDILVEINSVDGIETVKYKGSNSDKEIELDCNGKVSVWIDYEATDFTDYEFKIKINGKEEQTEILHFEMPRIKGNYTLSKGVYVNEPDLTGYNENNTRYLNNNESGNLVPGNWINGEKPENWYDYKNNVWANIYVEANGVDSYYVWIPRYCYKLDSSTQRSDVKFIDVYDNYKDENGNEIKWEELQAEGYKIPEAFTFDDTEIPGYWMTKYQLSNLSKYFVDYSTVATINTITIQNISENTDKEIAKYTYAINGQIVHESTNGENYTIEGVEKGNKAINVTVLDANGEIIGSMTKIFEVADMNEPDLTGFDPDTTFYVYWDEEGNEYNEIPIRMNPPENWYDYSTTTWANIVTRNNDLETYYVWIPRYQYTLDSTSQRSNVRFIKGTGTKVEIGYKIPEAFWWDNDSDGVQDDGEQLKGYWMTKYQLSTNVNSTRINAEMVAGEKVIKTNDITGSLITDAETNGINIKYEYYLNGEKKYEGTSSTEKYTYTGLEPDTTYTVNIIARNSDTNAYIGAITKKMTTIKVNVPDVSSFDPETTYYVIYNGDEEERISIKEKAPDNWYSYDNQVWANIVTTANNTETYFVWIPRYEYKLDTTNQRSNVRFIKGTSTETTAGYKIPEAFWWDNNGDGVQNEGEQLPGYWITKYQLGE